MHYTISTHLYAPSEGIPGEGIELEDGYMYQPSPERVIGAAEAEVQSKRPRLPCSFLIDNMFLLDKYDSHGKWLKTKARIVYDGGTDRYIVPSGMINIC
jgi:hypothetical protein